MCCVEPSLTHAWHLSLATLVLAVVQVWQLGATAPNFTLNGHQKGVNCLDYFMVRGVCGEWSVEEWLGGLASR